VAIRPEAAEIRVADPDDEPAAINFAEQSTWLLGYFNLNRLTSYPYSSWYMKEYDGYQFNSDAVNKLADINKDSLTIKIVLGTWCPDSRREVPRFMRILNIWQFSDTKVTFIGVDDTKVAPVGEYDNLNIKRVPTFIIYKGGEMKWRQSGDQDANTLISLVQQYF